MAGENERTKRREFRALTRQADARTPTTALRKRFAREDGTDAPPRGHAGVMVLAFELVDLGAFVGMGLSVLVVGALVVGLGLWLRGRSRADPPGLYRGL